MGDDDDDGLDGACVLRGLELLFCCFSPYRPQPRFVRERVRERESVRVEGVVKKQRQGRALRLSSLQYSPHPLHDASGSVSFRSVSFPLE